jgi:mono/diheme cytochrome c family protein
MPHRVEASQKRAETGVGSIMSTNNENRDYEHKKSVREHSSAGRERKDPETGFEPLSLWFFSICVLVLIIGGGYLGAKSAGFDFGKLQVNGYRAETPPNFTPAGPELSEYDKYFNAGEAVYKAVCNGCHQSNGAGQGQIPPLVESEWVTEGTERMAQIILNGIRGPIKVNGASYGAQEMPAQKGALNDLRVAQVMTYVRAKFAGISDEIITKEMVEDARNRHGGRATQYTVGELAGADAMLPGEQPAWMSPEGDPDSPGDAGDGEESSLDEKAPETNETN